MVEALEAVAWEALGESAEDVRRALSRLLERGPDSTENDCDPLFWALAGTPTGVSALAVATLPFVVALAANPATGARKTLVELLGTLSRRRGPVDPGWPEAWRRAHDTVQALLTDADPAVRREALPLAEGAGALRERWRAEQHPAVRLTVLFSLGDHAADPEVHGLLTGLLRDSDPVLRVAAVHTLARTEPELAVGELDALVEALADPALRSRWEAVWYVLDVDEPFSREDVAYWTAVLFEDTPAVETRFLTRLAAAADPTEDADLLRAVLDRSWRLLTRHRFVEAVLLPAAGRLMDHPDSTVRLRAVHLLAAVGPRAVAYADRLAGLLDDTGDGGFLEGTVGEHALWALTRMDDQRALPGLVERLCARFREEDGRSYTSGDPRRPELVDVLGPMTAHVDELLPSIREELRRGLTDPDADGYLMADLLEVLRAWGPAALPALPEITGYLPDRFRWHDAVQTLATLGPAAVSAAPAVRGHLSQDPEEHNAWLHWVLWRIGDDPAGNLRAVGEALPVTGESRGVFAVGFLTDFGTAAAPYADRVRNALESELPGARLRAAIALWSITGDPGPARPVLEEEFLAMAAGGEHYGSFGEALGALIRHGGTPGERARTALESLRAQDARLSPCGDYRAILDDERLRALIDTALSE
ncbi:HEAT repeat domain-containing protein [Streptomyces canus]|uniref:HEAT repeat domain-containing protein n=1 Tax=Streptomyces canus TaxID=58343 RepID=UPI002DDC2EA2|nr:HEAT repeat domain-containing protein [Streptomyces canus]WSD84283.1 HEAT repeat domain-containing protein [Streptomyces canus]